MNNNEYLLDIHPWNPSASHKPSLQKSHALNLHQVTILCQEIPQEQEDKEKNQRACILHQCVVIYNMKKLLYLYEVLKPSLQ